MRTPSAATNAGVGLFDIAVVRLCVSYQDVFLDRVRAALADLKPDD